MILERLIELRDRLQDDSESGLTPAYHKGQKVKWILEITEGGKFAGLIPTGEKKSEQKEFVTPYARRTSAPYPLLLADKSEYVLGDAQPGAGNADETATPTRHDLYRQLVEECADQLDVPALNTYRTFLTDEPELAKARAAVVAREVGPGEILLPRVDGLILTNAPAVRRFWQERQDREAGEKSGLESECMVCGEVQPIARIHPIELLVGADRVGMVTGNADSFLSYGLQQSEIAPMCQGCARGYGEGLNWLLRSETNRLRTGDITWVFWTRQESDFNPAKVLSDPEPDDVRQLLRAPFDGSKPAIDDNAFYALALSSNKSRLIVRNWLSVSLAEAKKNLLDYFERQKIVGGRDAVDAPIKLMALAGATVRDLKDLPPQVVPALINNALTGTPVPFSLLQQAVARARAERDNVMTRPRAALIKLILLSQPHSQEDIMPTLNPDHPHPAYHCGRLLALLDDVQYNAVGARATLIDRYYGAASTTPAVVFGALMRNAQNHLSKMRRDRSKYGLYVHFDRAIAEVASHIEQFPITLTLREQGLFALGFYQQKNQPRTSKAAKEVAENEAAEQTA